MILVLLSLAALAFVVWRIEAAIAHAPLLPSEPTHLDTLDGHGGPCCHLRCQFPATVVRVERLDLGGQLVRVCHGHSDEGDVRGWWVA